MSLVKIADGDSVQRLADDVLFVATGLARLVIEPNPSLLGQLGAEVERRFRHYGKTLREYVAPNWLENPWDIETRRLSSGRLDRQGFDEPVNPEAGTARDSSQVLQLWRPSAVDPVIDGAFSDAKFFGEGSLRHVVPPEPPAQQVPFLHAGHLGNRAGSACGTSWQSRFEFLDDGVVLQFDGGWDSAPLPVVDALRDTGLMIDPQQFGESRIATGGRN